MLRSLAAAVFAAGLGISSASAAGTEITIVYDADLGGEFAAKREIVELVKDSYGPNAVYDNTQAIPESVVAELMPGETLPAGVETEAVPAALDGRLPNTEPETSWVKVGEHLLEVRPDNTIVMGVYDVLPKS